MLLESYATTQAVAQTKPLKQNLVEFTVKVNHNTSPCYPSGSLPLDSPFYLQRCSLEQQVYQEISKPGALIRIKGPREMGKTSLLLRIINHAKKLGYYTISLNLEQVDQAILRVLNQFLRWLCANIARQLEYKPMLDEYWDQDLAKLALPSTSKTIY